MQAADLLPYLRDLPLSIWRYYDSIGSTNDIALKWVQDGAPEMAMVVADNQTAGRGRFQRHWVTNPGAALAFSLVLRPDESELPFLSHFAALGAIAIHQALQEEWDLASQIKWPNDILLGGSKVAGILIENTWLGNQLQALVMGIGLNISPQSVPPADQVMFPATSLEGVLGYSVDRWAVLRSIILKLDSWRSRLGTPEFLKVWEDHMAYKGEWVRISGAGQSDQVGKIKGLMPSGSLILVNHAGEEFKVDAGDVSVRSVDN